MRKLLATVAAVNVIGFVIPVVLSATGILPCKYMCDFVTQYIPFVAEIRRMAATGHPWWSWDSFLGDNFIAAYSYYNLGWPFTWIYACFPYRYIPAAAVAGIVIQNMLCAATARIYLRRMGLSDERAGLGALAYSLSPYTVTSWYYGIFSPAIILFPLMLACLERIIHARRCAVAQAALVTGVLFLANPYAGAVCVLLSLPYFLFRAAAVTGLRHCFPALMRATVACVVGIALSAVILVPTLAHCLSNPRVGESPDIMKMFRLPVSDMILIGGKRLIYTLLPRTTENWPFFMDSSCWSNTCNIPVFGLGTALLYMAHKKRQWLTMLLITLLLIYFTPLNAIFTLNTAGFYTRWAFALVLLLILATVSYVPESGSRIPRFMWLYWAAGTLFIAGWFILSLIGRQDNPEVLHTPYIGELTEIGLWFAGIILFIVAWRCRYPVKAFTLAVVLAGTAGLCLSTVHATGIFTSFEPQESFDRAISPALKLPQGDPDNFRYRTAVSGSLENHAQLCGTPGITTFHSLIHPSSAPLQRINGSYKNTKFRAAPEAPFQSIAGGIPIRELTRALDTGFIDSIAGRGATFAALTEYIRPCDGKTDFLGTSKGFRAVIENNSDHPTTYLVTVPFDPGFSYSVDGHHEPLSADGLGFIELQLAPGKHVVTAEYHTPGLTAGALISMAALITVVLLFFKAYSGRSRITP